MNQLIKTSHSESGDIIVSGRELHEFLEIKTEYMKWIARMIEYGFAENVDFIVIVKNVADVTAFGGQRKITDHHIKLDMAKELSMIQRTDKGKQARQYFIQVEKLMMYDKHGIKLGRNKMFEWLRDKGYLIKTGRERNNPKQKYIEQGLFETTVTLISRTGGDVESLTTLVTGKGQVKLAQILIKEFGTKEVCHANN